MTVSLYDLSVGSYIQIVEAASGVLKSGAEHFANEGVDLSEIVSSKLAPDMLDFHFQVVCITHHSIGAINGIKAGEFTPPNYPPSSYEELQKLNDETLSALKALTADEVNELGGAKLTFKLGDMAIPFTAENFLLSFSLPNFYFHATTAYDILRVKGVPLGKRDFLGAMKVGN